MQTLSLRQRPQRLRRRGGTGCGCPCERQFVAEAQRAVGGPTSPSPHPLRWGLGRLRPGRVLTDGHERWQVSTTLRTNFALDALDLGLSSLARQLQRSQADRSRRPRSAISSGSLHRSPRRRHGRTDLAAFWHCHRRRLLTSVACPAASSMTASGRRWSAHGGHRGQDGTVEYSPAEGEHFWSRG